MRRGDDDFEDFHDEPRDPDREITDAMSDAAADSQSPEVVAKRCRRILVALHDAGTDGLTREELEIAAGIHGDSLRPLVCKLRKAGFIGESGRTRKTRRGCNASVLELKRRTPPATA